MVCNHLEVCSLRDDSSIKIAKQKARKQYRFDMFEIVAIRYGMCTCSHSTRLDDIEHYMHAVQSASVTYKQIG